MTRWRRGVLVPLVVLALVAAGCGDGDDDATGGTTTETDDAGGAAEAEEITVNVDGEADDINVAFLHYFPSKVTARPGDTIVYESTFSGEPHSIAFGTVVQNAIDEFEKLTPEQLESEGPPPPELEAAFEAVPPMLPEGPGDAIQSSVNPCFIVSGEIPQDPEEPCEVREPEPFTGEEVFYNSGFLPDGETFEMQLSEDLPPGEYQGFCTLHFTEMISTITVVAPDEEIPSADEVAEEGQAELESLVDQLRTAADQAAADVEPGTVLAGAADESVRSGLVVEFLPEEIEVAAGDQITWQFIGPHTVTFDPDEDMRTLIEEDDDGLFHVNEKALAPVGFEPPPPPEGDGEGEGEGQGEGPPDGEGGPPPAIDGGTWDGTGTFSSGFGFDGFTLAISEPGSYSYVCLIHPEMKGTVTVK